MNANAITLMLKLIKNNLFWKVVSGSSAGTTCIQTSAARIASASATRSLSAVRALLVFAICVHSKSPALRWNSLTDLQIACIRNRGVQLSGDASFLHWQCVNQPVSNDKINLSVVMIKLNTCPTRCELYELQKLVTKLATNRCVLILYTTNLAARSDDKVSINYVFS